MKDFWKKAWFFHLYSKLFRILLGKFDKDWIMRISKMKKDELTETQKTIIEQMRKNPRITQWELCRILGINTTSVCRNVKKLKRLGFVRRIGPRYKSIDRYWEVLKQPQENGTPQNTKTIQ